MDASNSNITFIRCFDLGGGGLKSALVAYDSRSGEIEIKEKEVQLGKCPTTQKVSDWVRQKIDLDKEMENGFLFGFSLAGIEKLWGSDENLKKAKEWDPLKDENDNLLNCFFVKKLDDKILPGEFISVDNCPKDLRARISAISDGSAHTLASAHKLKNQVEGKIWNFSIGTGVGMGFTDEEKKLRTNLELAEFFGRNDIWNVKEPSTKSPVYQACSGELGFMQIKSKNPHEEFGYRWKEFIKHQIVLHGRGKNESPPAAITFTGGYIDHTGDRLVTEIDKHMKTEKTELLKNVRFFTGPKNAGVIGAALNAIYQNPKEQKATGFMIKLPENKDVLWRETGLTTQQAFQIETFIKANQKFIGTGNKFKEGAYEATWLPRPVEFHQDGKITIELKGKPQRGCTYKEGDLYEVFAGENVSKEKVNKPKMTFPSDHYASLGLEDDQVAQLTSFIEKNYASQKGTGKEFKDGDYGFVWLPRDVKFHEDGTVTIKLAGNHLDGYFYDPFKGEKLRKDF